MPVWSLVRNTMPLSNRLQSFYVCIKLYKKKVAVIILLHIYCFYENLFQNQMPILLKFRSHYDYLGTFRIIIVKITQVCFVQTSKYFGYIKIECSNGSTRSQIPSQEILVDYFCQSQAALLGNPIPILCIMNSGNFFLQMVDTAKLC